MPDIYGPILPLQLDPRNTAALVRDTQTKIFLESDGALNDFSPASPLSAIVEGQAFAQSELLYYINSLPEAYTLQWLRQLGIQRSVGAKSVAEVTFVKVRGFTRTVIIPRGTLVLTAGELRFILKNEVRIGDTATSGVGIVESEKWGSVYNVGVGVIEKININILGLDGVTNFTPASGGKDLETVENLKAKAFSLLRRRGLISAEDYYNEILTLAPADSVAKVLTYEERFNLESSLSSNVIVCLGDSNGEDLSNEIKSNILKSVRKKVPLGVSVSIIEPEVSPVETSITIEYDDVEFSSGVDFYASSIASTINSKLTPQEIELGEEFNYQELFNDIFNLNFVQAIKVMSIKILKLQPEDTDSYVSCNPPFRANTVDSACIDEYEAIVDSTSETFTNTNPIRTFRSYKTIVTLIASSTQSPITYTFLNTDYDDLLRS